MTTYTQLCNRVSEIEAAPGRRRVVVVPDQASADALGLGADTSVVVIITGVLEALHDLQGEHPVA